MRPEACAAAAPTDLDGGGGEQLTLRVVARYATHSNFGGKPHEWAHKRDVLRTHCEAIGRVPEEITMTWSPEVFIRETEADVELAGSLSRWGEPVDRGAPGTWWARRSRCARISRPTSSWAAGASCRGAATTRDTETLELLGDKVVPEFR